MEKYILKTNAHFGKVNNFFTKGTILEVNRENNTFKTTTRVFNDLTDVDIAIRVKLLIPFEDKTEKKIKKEVEATNKIIENVQSKKNEKPKKLPIIMSDGDDHPPIIIEKTKVAKEKEKSDKITVVRSGEEKEIRGLRVIENKETTEISNLIPNSEVSKTPNPVTKAVNGEKNVKAEEAKERAEKRKQEALKKRELAAKATERGNGTKEVKY